MSKDILNSLLSASESMNVDVKLRIDIAKHKHDWETNKVRLCVT